MPIGSLATLCALSDFMNQLHLYQLYFSNWNCIQLVNNEVDFLEFQAS
jgi:hypothetical protein